MIHIWDYDTAAVKIRRLTERYYNGSANFDVKIEWNIRPNRINSGGIFLVKCDFDSGISAVVYRISADICMEVGHFSPINSLDFADWILFHLTRSFKYV